MDNQLPNLNEQENKDYETTVRSLKKSYSEMHDIAVSIKSIFSTMARENNATISNEKHQTEFDNSIYLDITFGEPAHPWQNIAAEIKVNLFNLNYYQSNTVMSASISVLNNGDVEFKSNQNSIGYSKGNPVEALKVAENAIRTMISISDYATSTSDHPIELLRKALEIKLSNQKISELEKSAAEWDKTNTLRHAAKLREKFMEAFGKPTEKLINNLLETKATHIPVIMGSPSDAHMQFIIERFTIHSFTDAAGRKHYSLSDMNHRRKDLSKANLKERLKKELLVIDSKVVQDIKEIFPFYENFFSPNGYAYLKMIEVAKAIKSRNNLHSA